MSEDGVFPLAPSADHVGVLSADVAGARALLAVLADRPDVASPPTAAAQPRVGVLRGHLDDPSLTPEVAAAVERALRLAAAAGMTLVDLDPVWARDGARWEHALTTVVLFEAAANHRDRLRTMRPYYGPGTLALLDAGALVSEADYRDALAVAVDLRAAVDLSLAGVDVLAGPTVPYVAPEHDPPFGVEESVEGLFTGAYNLTGHPAISLPVPVTGLPVGLQLAAARGADSELLAVAAAVEAALATATAAVRVVA